MQPDLFKHFVRSILETKTNHMCEEGDDKNYVPYIVNRALSYYMDTVLLANEINMIPYMSKKAQYEFFLNTVVGKKRPFRPWLKKNEFEDLELVKMHYGYSNEKAKTALSLLTQEQVDYLKQKYNKGGIE